MAIFFIFAKMKIFSYILLFYFVAFSISPTIISLLKSKYEISNYCNLPEEQSQEQKEESTKKTFEGFNEKSFSCDLNQCQSSIKYNFSSFYNETLNCNFHCNIFIPPPKLV
jgi:hypothetical protein